MPDLLEQLYCAQQIVVPPTLPSILKKYAKAAIRTQPCDLLVWSSAYFRALSKGLPPPAKDRLEYPPIETPSGLTPGFLKILITQLGKGETVAKDDLVESWAGICLNAQALHDLLEIGMFEDEVKWLEFIAICAGTLQPSLTKTMIHLCELLTEEPEGGRASIPVEIFLTAYKFLAKLDCGPVNTRKQYELMMKEDSEEQCPSEEDKPMEEEEQSEVPVIDWDQAIETPGAKGESADDLGTEDGDDDTVVIDAADIAEDGANGEPSEEADKNGEEPINMDDLENGESLSTKDGTENNEENQTDEDQIADIKGTEKSEEQGDEEDDTKDEKLGNEEAVEDVIFAEETKKTPEEQIGEYDRPVSIEISPASGTQEESPHAEEIQADESGYETREENDLPQTDEDPQGKKNATGNNELQPFYIISDDGTLSAPNPDLDAAEALNDRDSDNTVKTRPSDDGMIVWPDIKVEEKEELSAMELVEKEVTSEDGIAEPQPEVQQEASEDEENIFAPKIDSLAGLVESEADVIVDTDAPLVPSSTSDSELLNHSSASIRSASERGSVMAASSSRNAEISNAYEMEEAEGEVQEGREEKPQQFDMKKEVDVKCLVKKDSEMMLLPTPVTSDVMLYVDNCDELESNKIASSQELVQKMTLLDVHVDIPIDETVEEVMTPFQHPKWMHIPGIGPAVPEDTIAAAEKYFLAVSELQEGMVMPRNIRNFQCPPLELIPDCTPEIDAYTEVPHQA